MKALMSVLLAFGVPKWAVVAALAALVSWAAPKVVGQIERDRARRIVKSARLDAEDKRLAADERALEVAGKDPHALMLLAEEAIEQGRKGLADQAMGRLRAVGVPEGALARLDERRFGALPGMPAEAALKIERLLERNQTTEARELATRCARRWPQDAELRGLLARCEEPTPAQPLA